MHSAKTGDRQMKDGSKYDLVVKDLFQRDHPSLLDQLTAGVAVREVLSVELARVEERRADLVLLLADGTILHIEFQSGNDKDMPYREGIYCLLLGQKYRGPVRQAEFGRLARWGDQRLAEATLVQIARWSKKTFTADTLEGVVGKR